jgi:hypothetical protein
METMNKKPMPTPAERPDLYDDFDGVERPAGWVNPVRVPERIQKLINERQAKTAAPAALEEPAKK